MAELEKFDCRKWLSTPLYHFLDFFLLSLIMNSQRTAGETDTSFAKYQFRAKLWRQQPHYALPRAAAASAVGLAALGEKHDDNDEVELLKVVVQSVPDRAELRKDGSWCHATSVRLSGRTCGRQGCNCANQTRGGGGMRGREAASERERGTSDGVFSLANEAARPVAIIR